MRIESSEFHGYLAAVSFDYVDGKNSGNPCVTWQIRVSLPLSLFCRSDYLSVFWLSQFPEINNESTKKRRRKNRINRVRGMIWIRKLSIWNNTFHIANSNLLVGTRKWENNMSAAVLFVFYVLSSAGSQFTIRIRNTRCWALHFNRESYTLVYICEIV